MFRQRLLTTLVLVPLVLLMIYQANAWLVGAVVLLLVLAGGWEWLQLIPVRQLVNQCIFIVVLLLATWLCQYYFHFWLILSLVLWAMILLAVLTFPTSQETWGNRAIVGGACLLLLSVFANTLAAIYLHTKGKDLIVYLLCIVWATDIGAYLAGKYCGRHKLIPKVSPGKTIEGATGGFVLAMIVAAVAYWYFSPQQLSLWFAVAVGTALISMLGDLFISMLKRRSNIKDTGQIIPGHGGILDRLDSLIAAAPLFYYGIFFVSF